MWRRVVLYLCTNDWDKSVAYIIKVNKFTDDEGQQFAMNCHYTYIHNATWRHNPEDGNLCRLGNQSIVTVTNRYIRLYTLWQWRTELFVSVPCNNDGESYSFLYIVTMTDRAIRLRTLWQWTELFVSVTCNNEQQSYSSLLCNNEQKRYSSLYLVTITDRAIRLCTLWQWTQLFVSVTCNNEQQCY